MLLFSGRAVERLDHVIYDAMLRVHERPASAELLIVAIDENSLRQLGQWPWPRRIHAQLLDRLTAAGASAVGIDILFSEHDDTGGDDQLAAAIERNGRVTLVVGPGPEAGRGSISELLPLPELAVSAAWLAHVDFELDSDGICRRVFLRAGMGDAHWPAMGSALLKTAHPELAPTPGPASGSGVPTGTGWVREMPILIAYAGPPGHVKRLSYVDVLQGRVPPESLRGRIVLIGATAAGLGDVLSTPLSGDHELMPGVEINANVVDTLLKGRQLVEAGGTLHLFASLVPIFLIFLWLLLMPGSLALPGFLLVATATLIYSLVLLQIKQVWFAPVLSLLLQSALYVVWSWLDLGQAIRLSQRLAGQLRLQAHSDRLTGLPNRLRLEEQLGRMLTADPDGSRDFALFVLSMGRHREVIDQFGVRGNDELQQRIADRLRAFLPDPNRLYRLDGTEFAVLIDHAGAPAALETLASRLVQSLLRPFRLGANQFILNPGIGASRYPQDGRQSRELIDNAYAAMHRAWKDKRRSFCFYTQDIKADVRKRSTIYQGVTKSAWTDQLVCLYQPQASLHSGRVVGVEALVRWHHPTLGEILPSEFIPLAEREGLIVTLGSWVLHQACRQGTRLRENLGREMRLSVNVSAVQLESPGLAEAVAQALHESGLPACSLELELTETALLSEQEAFLSKLEGLKSLGVGLAIDDFGTGYSTLTYLKNFPVDRVKIDQSFVSDMHDNSESAEITRSIVAMTHGLNLGAIAEGVERREHLAYLDELGCDEVQGYFIGKPIPADDFEAAVTRAELKLARVLPPGRGR